MWSFLVHYVVRMLLNDAMIIASKMEINLFSVCTIVLTIVTVVTFKLVEDSLVEYRGKNIFKHPIVDGDSGSNTHDVKSTALAEQKFTLAICKLPQRNLFHSLPS